MLDLCSIGRAYLEGMPQLRRPFPVIFATLALICCSAIADDSKPHLVLFIADDLSWSDCSIYAAGDTQTPNVERIARDGMACTHAFVASPSCAPSRAALLTGLYPARNGAMWNHQLPYANIKKWPA